MTRTTWLGMLLFTTISVTAAQANVVLQLDALGPNMPQDLVSVDYTLPSVFLQQPGKFQVLSQAGNLDCGTPDDVTNQFHLELDGRTYLFSDEIDEQIDYDLAAGTLSIWTSAGDRMCESSGITNLYLGVDDSPQASLRSGINYDLVTGVISVHTADPVLCVDFGATTQPVQLAITDPNGVSQGFFGLSSLSYSSDKVLSVATEESLTCFVAGVAMTKDVDVLDAKSADKAADDIIFVDDFAERGVELSVSLFAEGSAVIGRNFVYTVIVENSGPTTAHDVKVRDFFPSNTDVYSATLTTGQWDCVGNGGAECGTSSGSDQIMTNEHTIPHEGQVVYTVTRAVNSGSTGSIVLTAAAFSDPGDNEVVTSNNITARAYQVIANSPPTISTIADQEILEDGATSILGFNVDDLETNPLALIVTAVSSNQSVVPNGNIALGGTGTNRTVQVTPAPDANGSVTITVTVDDGASSADETFDVNITPVNDLPVLLSITPIDHAAGTPAGQYSEQTWVGLDHMGAANEFQSLLTSDHCPDGFVTSPNTSSPYCFRITDENGVLLFAPTVDEKGDIAYTLSGNSGSAGIDFVVRDDGGTSDGGINLSEIVTGVITVASNPPTVSSIDNQLFDEDGDSGTIHFTVGDAETPAGDLIVTAASSDQSLIPDGNLTLGGSDADRTIVVTPVVDGNGGPVTITVEVDDGSSIVTEQFDVTVNPINDPPSFIHAGDQSHGSADVGTNTSAGWVQSTDFGPDDEDATQGVDHWEFGEDVDDPDGILEGLPAIVNGDLSYDLTGSTGSATVDVRLIDNGGTSGGGIPESQWQSFQIDVLACQQPPSGLAGWWAAESDFTDWAGPNHGIGGDSSPAFVNGQIGFAFSFDGVDNQFTVADDDALDLAGEGGLSVAFWINSSATSASLVRKVDSDQGGIGYEIALDSMGRLTLDVDDGLVSRVSRMITSNNIVADGNWHHVVTTMRWSGVVGQGGQINVSLYVDGTEGTNPSWREMGPISNDADLTVGSAALSGLIDEVMIYNREISESEAGVLHGAAVGGFCATDLSVTLSDSLDPIDEGGRFTYTLSVINNGDVHALEVDAHLTMDGALTLVSSDCNALFEDGQELTCSLAQVDAGTSSDITFTVNHDGSAATPLTSTAAVDANTGESAATDNSTSEETGVGGV